MRERRARLLGRSFSACARIRSTRGRRRPEPSRASVRGSLARAAPGRRVRPAIGSTGSARLGIDRSRVSVHAALAGSVRALRRARRASSSEQPASAPPRPAERRPEERPREALARQHRRTAALGPAPGAAERAAEATSSSRSTPGIAIAAAGSGTPTLLDDPDRVVPALPEEPRRQASSSGNCSPSSALTSSSSTTTSASHSGIAAPSLGPLQVGIRDADGLAHRPSAHLIAAQGYAARSRTGTRREVEDDDPRALVRPARLDHRGRAKPPHHARLACRRVSARDRLAPARPGPHLRVLGARGVPHPRRGVAAVPGTDEGAPSVARRCHRKHPELADEVRAAIRERGPIASRDFEGKGGGGMWNWKPAKMVLEALWNAGEIVIAGRVSGFQRSYDLAERVIPREVLDAPVPDEPTRDRELALRSVRARGALTDAGIVEHWRMRGGAERIVRRRTPSSKTAFSNESRVEDGGCRRARRSGRRARPPETDRRRPPLPLRQPALGPALRAPRPRLRPPDRGVQASAERQFGYYVLPFLWRDRIVGRADLKSERGAGRSSSRRSTSSEVFAAPPRSTTRRAGARPLRRTIGLDRVVADV